MDSNELPQIIAYQVLLLLVLLLNTSNEYVWKGDENRSPISSNVDAIHVFL